MGTRNGSETAVGVLQAFYRKRQWRQAELARMLGVTGETVVKVLRNLGDAGVPLTRDDSDRPQVWWTKARGWVPGGVFFPKERVPALLRTLVRSPRSRERDACWNTQLKWLHLARRRAQRRIPLLYPRPNKRGSRWSKKAPTHRSR